MLNFQKGRSHTSASYKNKRKQQSKATTPQYNTQSQNPLVPHTPPANPKNKTILGHIDFKSGAKPHMRYIFTDRKITGLL